MGRLRELFIPQAVIVRTGGLEPTVYDIAQEVLIEPHGTALLTGGTLTDFREWPLSGRIDVFGDVAQYFGSYAKSWVQACVPFVGAGKKTIQFIRTGQGWRISAVAWDDEREGLTIDRA